MRSLVAFDSEGVFGPAMTLIYNSQYYSKEGISDLSTLLKANFLKLTGIKAKGKKEFCNFILQKNQIGLSITPTEVISTNFFKNMQKLEPSAIYHEKILRFIVPPMMKTVQELIPNANTDKQNAQINAWTARFVESYLTQEQIQKYCEFQSTSSEKIMEERKDIGIKLYNLATTKHLTENDLDILLEVSKFAIKRLQTADHFSSILDLTGRYLTLFSMDEENPALLGKNVLHSLSTTFREKMFPKNI